MSKDLLKLVVIGAVLFTAGFFLKSVGIAENTADATEPGAVHMTATMDDGLVLHAWISDPEMDTAAHDKAPLVFLMPMMSLTHLSYQPFTQRLVDHGYAVVAFDLRGHGLSISIGDSSISYASMEPKDFALLPSDIETFFTALKDKYPDEYSYTDVTLIGASIGANTAGLLLDRDWVCCAVLLSPGRDYRGLRPELVMIADDVNKPVYITAGADDKYSAESSEELFDDYAGLKVFKKYPGQDHGTNILYNIPDADTELVKWLMEWSRLKK